MALTNQPMPRWLELIQQQLNLGLSIQLVAKKIGVSRSALSQIINKCGPYGTGMSSTKNIERKTLEILDKFVCPHLSETRGEEVLINGELCRSYALRTVPTGVAHQVRHWQACQQCPLKPAPTREIELVGEKNDRTN